MPTATADVAPGEPAGRVVGVPDRPGETVRPTAFIDRVASAASTRVDSASYVVFRVAFGLLAAISQLRFLARGWVDRFYLTPEHHLTYPGFEWVRPLPGVAMYGLVLVLAALGVSIAVGYRPRISAAVFAIGFTYCELIEASLYLNHYWFITLVAVLLAAFPGVDRTDGGSTVPRVTLWALRFQLGVVYVYAGAAKLNADWLLRGEPLGAWLSARTDRPIVGALLDEPFVALWASWSGALFDLTIVGWLLWRRSRPLAYVALIVFHLATAALFQIGLFPWIMIGLTPIFFDPAWPRRFRWVAGRPTVTTTGAPARAGRPGLLWSIAVIGFVAVNLAVPLRHVAADGNVRWNDDGYLLSWRVMSTERASHVRYEVTDTATGAVEVVDSTDVLTEWQAAVADVRADLILSTAHLIADDRRSRLGVDVEVRALAVVAWNGRLRTEWIDPTVDLAALVRNAPAAAYVRPAPR